MPLPGWAALLVIFAGAGGALLGWRTARRSRPSHQHDILLGMLEHSFDAAYRRDLRTDTYDYLSPALARVMGVSPDQLRTMPVQTLIERIHPEDRAGVAAAVATNARSGRVEYRFLGNDAVYRWVADHYTVDVDTHGQPVYRSGILRDVSDQRQAEAALRVSEARYRMLFESIEDGFCIVQILLDEHGTPYDYRFLEGNPAFEDATGLRSTAGKTALALVPGLDLWWVRTYAEIARTGIPQRFENHSTAMDRWFDVYAFRFGAPEGLQVAIFFKNVTAQKRAELERVGLLERERSARADAEHSSRLKDDFVATVSHELRTPLNAMLGWAQILRRGVDQATVAQGLVAIERNALAQSRLIEDLLDMSRIVSGTIALEISTVDLRQVILAAMQTARPAAEAKQLRLEADLHDDAAIVRGDAVRLPQVAWNLLSNAVKFSARGGTVRVTLSSAGANVRFAVSDTGEGIASSFLPHVFDRFRQADASTTRTHGGLGLGLSIVKQIVELHGGQVAAASDGPGRGATFVVELPRVVREHLDPSPGSASDVVADAAGDAAPAVSLANITVLAVDDEPDALEVIRRVLEVHDARVVTASSAEEAVRLCGSERPHVLLADIGMPLVDGFALIGLIRALGPGNGGDVPAAALTAFARAEDRTMAMRAGFQTHLAKPVTPAMLLATVAGLAGRGATAGAPRPVA